MADLPAAGGLGAILGDTGVFIANVAVSVIIVFANKVLMGPPWRFVFATCLSALHFFASGGVAYMLDGLNKKAGDTQTQKASNVPFSAYMTFSLLSASGLASLNLSLRINSVGFFQIAKLMIIPYQCLLEALWFKRRFGAAEIASMMVVMVGVGIVTVYDVTINAAGLAVAAVVVVCSGTGQIYCGLIQRTYAVSSNQLLFLTGPIQGGLLMASGPFIDYFMTGRWVWDYTWSVPAAGLLAVSCVLAACVNLTHFMVLRRFSAVTFQVVSNTKTVLILTCSWLFLHELLTPRQVAGMVLAVAGMAYYGYLTSKPKQQAPEVQPPKQAESEATPLMSDGKDGLQEDESGPDGRAQGNV